MRDFINFSLLPVDPSQLLPGASGIFVSNDERRFRPEHFWSLLDPSPLRNVGALRLRSFNLHPLFVPCVLSAAGVL